MSFRLRLIIFRVFCHKLLICASLLYRRTIRLKMIEDQSRAEVFGQYRQRLFGIAYRMTGTTADSEDIVQEAYLRWHKTEAEEIETPEAWLVTITTRLAIDRLRTLAKERETYIGPWLPEPLFNASLRLHEDELEFADNLSIAFMMLLERLSPQERAAFLLRDVFDCSYTEIARIVGKTEPSCRQMIHRARERVKTEKPRFETNEADRRRLIEKFMAATRASDEETLLSLFAEDASMISDGGGRVPAARKIIEGSRKIARLYSQYGKKGGGFVDTQIRLINGELGVLTTAFGQVYAATTFEFDGEKIRAVYQVMNPEKLKKIAGDGDAFT